jgi:hypothetical protein
MTFMQTLHNTPIGSKLNITLLCVAIYCGFAGPSPVAIGQETSSKPALPELTHGLQGLRFIGPLAAGSNKKLGKEVLTFKDGKFSSQLCLKLGFAPAPYWVRRDAQGLHFEAELRSPERGTMKFVGVFDGEAMSATALWTKKRWYWTIEQTLHFTGRPLRHGE